MLTTLPMSSSHAGVRAVSRFLIGLVVISLMVVGVPTTPVEAQTGPPMTSAVLQWDDFGSPFTTFQENEHVYISLGKASLPTHCVKQGGFFPAVDIYVVSESALPMAPQEKLKDVSNTEKFLDGTGLPNTILTASSGLFVDQRIGIAGPTGDLAPGRYGVVYDECQDGNFDFGDDTLFFPAFDVAYTVDSPNLDDALFDSKQLAKTLAEAYTAAILISGELLKALPKIMKLRKYYGCLRGGISSLATCATTYLVGQAEELRYRAVLANFGGKNANRAFEQSLFDSTNQFAAFHADPPDAHFQIHPTLLISPPAVVLEADTDPLEQTYLDSREMHEVQAALTQALVAAVERYQGARDAGSGEWALIHARGALMFVSLLRSHVTGPIQFLIDLDEALVADTRDLEMLASEARNVDLRIAAEGMNPTEVQVLRNRGVGTAEMAEIADLASTDPQTRFTKGVARSQIEQLLAAYGDFQVGLEQTESGLADVIEDLVTNPMIMQAWPVADAGGPYDVGESRELLLDGSAATDSGRIVASWEWDLDLDGEFDDAVGPAPTVGYPRTGLGLIGLRVTDSHGRQSVSYTSVGVLDVNVPPTFTSLTPDEIDIELGGGDSIALAAAAHDPDGDAVELLWFVDHEPSETATSSLVYSPLLPEDLGIHFVRVVASDGDNSIAHEWIVTVLAPDVDADGWRANVDCDDSDPAANPGAYEAIGNGIDDDCDPATLDSGSPPDAAFVARPQPALAGDLIEFADLSTDPNGPIALWSWDFGDGGTSTEAAPTHSYGAFGDYTVQLEVTDQQGDTATVEKTVTALVPPTSGTSYGYLALDNFISEPTVGEARTPYADESARLYGRNDIVTASGLTPAIPTVQCQLAAGGGSGYSGSGEDTPGAPVTARTYVIPDTGEPLVDNAELAGFVANVTAAADGSFAETAIATTQAGGLAEGRYDIVLDHCNDGQFNASLDIVIGDGAGYAFGVAADTGALPRIQLGYLMERSLAASLSLAGPDDSGLCAAFDDFAASVGSGPVGFSSEAVRLSDACESAAGEWRTLGSGPHLTDYGSLARLGSVDYQFAGREAPLRGATRRLANYFDEQRALIAALDLTIRRFNGAYDAADHGAMWRQLLHMRQFTDLLVGGGGNVLRTYAALEALDDAVSDGTWAGDPSADALLSETLGARRGLAGLLDAMGMRFRIWRSCHVVGPDLMFPVGLLAWITAYTTTDYGYLSSGIVSIGSYRAEHDLPPLESPYPTADTTGPYLSPPDRAVSFDAGESRDPDDGPLTFAWELDGDGVFDDGAAVSIERSFSAPGTRLIGVQVTDTDGLDDLAYVLVKIGDVSNQSMIVVRHNPRQIIRVEPDGTSTVLYEVPFTPGYGGDPIYGGNTHAVQVQPEGDFYLINSSGGIVHFDEDATELRRLPLAEISSLVGFTIGYLGDMEIDGRGHLILTVSEKIATDMYATQAIVDLHPDWGSAQVLAHGELTLLGIPSLALDPEGRLVLGGMRDLSIGDWTHLKGQGALYTFDRDTTEWDQLVPGEGAHLEDGSYYSIRLMMGGEDLHGGSNLGQLADSGVQVDGRGDVIFSDQYAVYRIPTPPAITEHPVEYNQRLVDVETFRAYRGITGEYRFDALGDMDLDSGGDYLLTGWDSENRWVVMRVTPEAEYFKVADLLSPLDFPSYGTSSSLSAIGLEPELREVTPRDVSSAPDLRFGGVQVAQEACPGSADIMATVHNEGTVATADSVRVVFWDGDPLFGGTVIGTDVASSPIPGGSGVEVSVPWDDPAPGSHEIFVTALGAGTAATAHTVCTRAPGEEPLVLVPRSASLSVGESHELTVIVRDPAGQPMPGAEVVFTISGVHDQTVTVMADAWGSARFRYVGWVPGADEIIARTGEARSNAVTIDWVRVNHTPLALDTNLVTQEDAPLVVVLEGSDSDGDRLTFVATSSPTHGELFSSPPTLVYAPDPGFSGVDSFNFTADDGLETSRESTITITVEDVNDAPVADAGGPYTTEEGTSVSFDGSGSYDVDDEIVSYEWDLDDDGEYDDAAGMVVSHTFGDNGTYRVWLRVVDAGGGAGTAMVPVEVLNAAPDVAEPVASPEPSQVGDPATAEATFTDVGEADGPFVCTVDYGEGEGPQVGTVSDHTCTGSSHMYQSAGTFAVHVAVTDKDGGTGSHSVVHEVASPPPTVSAGPENQEVQYSDTIADVTISAFDVATDTLTIGFEWSKNGGAFSSGLPGALSSAIDGCDQLDGYQTCTWTLAGVMGDAAGSYTVRSIVSDGTAEASADTIIEVNPEDATIRFPDVPDANPVAVRVAEPAGVSGTFELSVDVQELNPDVPTNTAAPGDISFAQVSMSLEPVGPGSPVGADSCVTDVVGSGYAGVLTATCSFDAVAVNTYALAVNVNGGYFAAGGTDVLVIYDPSLGFTTGGGWFYWPGTEDKTNFGYVMKYNKKGEKVKGSLLITRHVSDGSIYRIKSNALYGLAIGQDDSIPMGYASFSGKATYTEPGWPDPEGNHEFLVYVEDSGEPGADSDQLWLEVLDKDGQVVERFSMSRPASQSATSLGGGNIVVPHTPR